jgi:hypothetical protein
MKSTFLLLATFAMLLTSTLVHAQITTTGMAIQGIARDGNNNAITNTQIGLKFTIHYTKNGSDEPLTPSTATLTTDAFGVFSYVLDMSAIENTLFYDYQLKLKIEQTSPASAVISDEDLRFVPYAVSASNGVPTGSIMPFVGTVAPRGWALCNGQALPLSASALRAMVGDNAPDLRGMFVRGAGTNSNNTYANNVGPELKALQTNAVGQHANAQQGAQTITGGSHEHTYRDGTYVVDGNNNYYPGTVSGRTNLGGAASWDGNNSIAYRKNDGTISFSADEISTSTSESHTHGLTLSGDTALNSGAVETRPINYGVNYIIKL